MMDFQLIDCELAEGRLYRTTRNFQQLNGRDVANLLYLSTLTLLMLARDDVQHKYAVSYASKTTQYGSYALFRTHGTDLYLLAYQTAHPKNKSVKLDDGVVSKVFLDKLNFQSAEHWKFVREIAADNVNSGRAMSYLNRLETQLKISDARYKQWRRLIVDWNNLKDPQRQLVVAGIVHEFRRLGRGAEFVAPLTTMLKYRTFTPEPAPDDRPGLGQRIAGTVAGAAAGRYLGGKVATALDRDVDKYKTAGTGIGALAGYWASGKRRQV
jgi:hypothetical protein